MYRLKSNQFGPRVRFNWGFHDATRERKDGYTRRLSETIHSTEFVGRSRDPLYYAGYEAGLAADMSAGRPESSEPAWLAFRATLSAGQLREVYDTEVNADLVTCGDPKRRPERLPTAERYAADVCGFEEG
jgi:hypothetical protein